jgi:hypothetical protein
MQDTSEVTRGMPGEVVDYLRLHHIITLSTSSFTGMPHADTVVYTNDGHRMFFSVNEGTQILRNIKDSRRVSFTIDDYTLDWKKVRELQGVGLCQSASNGDHEVATTLFRAKFGDDHELPPGVLHTVTPHEMHFVDFDYAKVMAGTAPVRSRTYQIEDAPPPPSQGAVSTDLDRLTFEPGEIVFRPGDSSSEYYVVIDGEVEIRGEGFGADQTVLRLGPGQFFGDQSTLRGQQGALTCHAVTQTALLAVDRESIRDLIQSGTD